MLGVRLLKYPKLLIVVSLIAPLLITVILERVQKPAYKIIFCNNSYEKILIANNLQTLESRRADICRKFAEKSSKNEHFRSWFKINKNPYNTRKNMLYKPVFCRTNAWKNSPIPQMTELLNNIQE